MHPGHATCAEQGDPESGRVPVLLCSGRLRRPLRRLTERGMGTLPVCMSKTHLSLSHDPALKGRPRGFTVPIRNVYPSAGAGFIVALAGDIQLMPGLGKEPAYTRIDIDSTGTITGLT